MSDNKNKHIVIDLTKQRPKRKAAKKGEQNRKLADHVGAAIDEYIKAKKAKTSKVKMVTYKGCEWLANKRFEIEKLIGKMVSAGEVPGRGSIKAGTVLYKVLWKDFPPKIATWEEERSIHDDYIDEYEAGLEAEAQLEGGESDDERSDE